MTISPLALGLIGAGVGVGIVLATDVGNANDSSDSPEVTEINYRAHTGSPHDLRGAEVLNAGGLTINVQCREIHGSPVAGATATSADANASLATDYSTRRGERYTFVLTNWARLGNSTYGLLGPIGLGDAQTGTLTYTSPGRGSVTVTFLAMNGAPGSDCVFAGTAHHARAAS